MNTEPNTQTPAPNPRRWLDMPDVCAELGVHRRTAYDWWATGRGPRRIKLPNGDVRVRADWLDDFMLALEVDGGEAA